MSDLDLQERRRVAIAFLDDVLARRHAPVSVLDVGCGPEDLLDGYSREQVRVFGVDLSPQMIAVASARHPTDTYRVSDATDLPFETATMDVVTCLGVIEYISRPKTALREIRRVLRPDGHLIVSFPNRSSLFRRLSTVEVAVERAFLHVFNRIRGRSVVPKSAPSYAHRQWSPKEAGRLLSDEGFPVQKLRFNTFGLYGRLGRLRVSLASSRWLSRRLGDRRSLGHLGQTMVICASGGQGIAAHCVIAAAEQEVS